MKKSTFSILVALLCCNEFYSSANNIAVSNISLTDQNVGSHYCNVKFDISWDNSWRTSTIPYNWDAAWVFIKYRISGGNWNHATIDSTSAVTATGSTMKFPSDFKGVFMYRDTNGSGSNNWTDNKIRWKYGDDGVADDASIEAKVFAIEMVYIPQASFYAGDNATSTASFKQGSSDNDPWYITSENQIDVTNTASNGYYYVSNSSTGENATGDAFTISTAFPKGYAAFYIMKYETSQEQYVNFLNTLTRTQQQTNVSTDISGTNITNRYIINNGASLWKRNGIRCDATIPASPSPVTFYCDYNGNDVPNEGDDGQNIPCNSIGGMRAAAYMDWAGLRLMTELEFEKACRGTNNAVNGEYAWGNTSIHAANYTLTNAGYANESISNISTIQGNAYYSNTNNTYGDTAFGRCGIFAASSSNHNRQETGASYYGVMEMSGNLSELCVNVGSEAGRSYTGLHGNGTLNNDGNADVDYWPGINGNTDFSIANTTYGGTTGVTAGAGNGQRGGSGAEQYLRTSSRYNAVYSYSSNAYFHGFRAARTAP